MIHSFTCKNFYSFKSLNTVSFVVNEHAPKNNGFFNDKSGTRLSKIETVIGPNASGKTNLLKVLPFLKWLIIDSYMLDPLEPLLLQPYLLSNKNDQNTELSVIFEIEGLIYQYEFIVNQDRILKEILQYKSKTDKRFTYKTAFEREWDSRLTKYKFKANNFKFSQDFENTLRMNTSVVGSAIRQNHISSKKIADFWKNLETNVIEQGYTGDGNLSRGQINLVDALNFFYRNENFKKNAEKLLSNFDLGLHAFEIKKEKFPDGSSIIGAEVSHLINNKLHSLDLSYESSGTKQLFVLLKKVLLSLSNGSVAVLDEIDVNLHPEIVIYILNMFTQPETNPHNAQLIFSTHNHLVLNKLNKYQIVFVEKNKNIESCSWRLDQMDGIRTDDNYFNKYIVGTYGAFPNL